MSDFDKEKEREKLREKYEQEEADREATRQMSELLLQGATMTNQHCEECGNPVFRYDGQEFCPHCQQADGDAGSQAAGEQPEPQAAGEEAPDDREAGAQSRRQGTGDGTPPRQQPDQEDPAGDAQPDRDATGGSESVPPAGESSRESAERTPARSVDRTPGGEAGSRVREGGDAREAGRRRPGRAGRSTPAGTGDLADGEAALREALTKFARLAAETDDPRRARDHLAAAREAAEALAALRR